MMTPAVTIRPMRQDDLPLIAVWLAAPHVSRWWGDPDAELRVVKDILQGLDGMSAFIFECDGAPGGHLQSWRLDAFRDEQWLQEAPWISAFPPGTVGVDILIGETGMTGHGIGPRVLRQFAGDLFAAGAERVIIDPDAANTVALAAYLKAGFLPAVRHDDEDGATIILELTPESLASPT